MWLGKQTRKKSILESGAETVLQCSPRGEARWRSHWFTLVRWSHKGLCGLKRTTHLLVLFILWNRERVYPQDSFQGLQTTTIFINHNPFQCSFGLTATLLRQALLFSDIHEGDQIIKEEFSHSSHVFLLASHLLSIFKIWFVLGWSKPRQGPGICWPALQHWATAWISLWEIDNEATLGC